MHRKCADVRRCPAITKEAQKCEVCLKVLFHFAGTLRESLYGACFRNGPSSTHTQRKSARIIAAALNTVSTSREIPHEFRYHAKVLNDHLDEVLRSSAAV